MVDNNYNYQKEANILCLLEDKEYLERKEALFKIVNEFEKNGIRYGLACSMNLFLNGIVDEFHDLDFIIELSDTEKVKEVMEKIGAILKETGGNGYCESDVYMHFQLERVDIDIISGFRLLTFGTNFQYKFNENELVTCYIKNFTIPLIPLEALYVLYYMMEGWQPRRRYKRKLIEQYLIIEGVSFPKILENSLTTELPLWIKKKIKLLLN
ncbi:MAG: hypothetical protein BHW00_00675 [Clostridium sp. 26_22]|nr:MAG: hypothetical protein BHW00_00675 [Clostridium sp. 26_22]